ncbi:MAG: hypothetical protein EBS32_10150 [Actinobacteria bacterium]|nr:hypothetical protein [Actinomycetota bacterium]
MRSRGPCPCPLRRRRRSRRPRRPCLGSAARREPPRRQRRPCPLPPRFPSPLLPLCRRVRLPSRWARSSSSQP